MEVRETEILTSCISPLQMIHSGKIQNFPVPLARITTCGLLQIEVLKEVVSTDPLLGRYEVVSTQTLRGRGAVPSLMLLKLLASRTHRFATNDWLATQMKQEMEKGAEVRLDTITSYLRGLLCKIETDQEHIDALRLLVVEYLRNGRGSGPGYRLGPYPLLWLDTEALTYQIEHGILMENMGEPALALPFWQRAYQLASKGEYLLDEPHSDWAQSTREQVAGHLKQSVHTLRRLLLAQHGEVAKEEVILLLRTYWLTHKTDEDVLRPLMELLGEQERFGEAQEYYQQCVAALEQMEAGRQLAKQTHDLHEFLRIKQLRRQPKMEHQNTLLSLSSAPLSTHQQGTASMLLISPTAPGLLSASTVALPASRMQQGELVDMVIPDCATRFGLMLAQMIALVEKWYGMARFCSDLQDQLDRNIKRLDELKSQYALETYVFSRRSFLTALAALPTALLASSKQTYSLILNLEELLPRCAASVTACWHLSGGSHLDTIAPIIDSYLPTLVAVMEHAPSYREVTATLVAQCYFLKTILAWHVEGLATAEAYCVQAMQYSEIAKNTNLQLTALNQHSLILYYAKQFRKALAKSEEADTILRRASHEPVFPIVQGRVYMYLAAIQAQQNRGSAEDTLELAKKAFALQASLAEPVPLYADCGEAPLTLWDGLTHYHLSFRDSAHSRWALASLRTFGQLQANTKIPERFRLECLTNRTLAAIQCNEQEEAIACLAAGKQGARALESRQRNTEVEYAYQTMLGQWSGDERVQVLGMHPESMQ
jgi:hypothetical protein